MKKRSVHESGAERARRILQARAEALAHVADKPTGGTLLEIVVFRLAYETYGLETRHIREVYALKELTILPGTPRFVAGIVNVRGQVLSVVDIKTFFELPIHGLAEGNKILIVKGDDMEFGILADEIVEVRNIREHELQAALPTLTEIRSEYLKGITPDRVVVLDARKLLLDPRIVVHEEVARTGT